MLIFIIHKLNFFASWELFNEMPTPYSIIHIAEMIEELIILTAQQSTCEIAFLELRFGLKDADGH